MLSHEQNTNETEVGCVSFDFVETEEISKTHNLLCYKEKMLTLQGHCSGSCDVQVASTRVCAADDNSAVSLEVQWGEYELFWTASGSKCEKLLR